MPAVTQKEVLTALKDCYDPEIPVNIVDLGLIYNVSLEPAEPAEGQPQQVLVDMTLTTPGCPAHTVINEQVRARVLQIPGIDGVSVNLVWEPPWTPERLSEAARKQLGIEV
jgi:metal-sulfur cluster biosynthetic enzyme